MRSLLKLTYSFSVKNKKKKKRMTLQERMFQIHSFVREENREWSESEQEETQQERFIYRLGFKFIN